MLFFNSQLFSVFVAAQANVPQGANKKISIPNGKVLDYYVAAPHFYSEHNADEIYICFQVGLIIGKGGETIKYLQHQSGAKIQITKDSEADPYSLTRDVELMGTSEQISRAEQLINDVISQVQ